MVAGVVETLEILSAAAEINGLQVRELCSCNVLCSLDHFPS